MKMPSSLSKCCAVAAGFVLCVAMPMSLTAATLRVARDGSGDFTMIQPALDAAASGDTVMIGPGEYTEYTTMRLPFDSWDVDVFAFSSLPYLTIIGAGPDETVIGPVVPMRNLSTFSAKGVAWSLGTELRLSGVTVRNCYEGMHVTDGVVYVDNCRLVDNSLGIVWHANSVGGAITNVEIRSTAWLADGIMIFGGGHTILLQNVRSIGGGRFYLENVTGVTIENCEVSGDPGGIAVYAGAEATIRNCRVSNGNYNVYVHNSEARIEDSIFSGGGAGISANAYSTVTVTGSIISGASYAGLHAFYPNSFTVTNSHILKGSGYAVHIEGGAAGNLVTYDLTNNYWGTSSADSIAAWIWDHADSPDDWGRGEFVPFSGQEVPTERHSWGDVKALYR